MYVDLLLTQASAGQVLQCDGKCMYPHSGILRENYRILLKQFDSNPHTNCVSEFGYIRVI